MYSDVSFIAKKPRCDAHTEIDYYLDCFKYPTEYLFAGYFFDSNSIETPLDLIHFASHIEYSLSYVFDRQSGYVSLWSGEAKQIEWHCSPSLLKFFTSMRLVMQTKTVSQKQFVEVGMYELDQEYLAARLKECMSVNDNNLIFHEFYTHILGV